MIRENKSEVARLLEQIGAEYEAAERGLSGLSYGASRHEFITQKMENVGQIAEQLQQLVGDQAIPLIYSVINNAPSQAVAS